jgi:Tol biopolymer transport system component
MNSAKTIALVATLLIVPGCVNGVSWLPDSSDFVFTTDRGRLVLYDVKTKAVRVLVEDTKSSTYWPAVSPDGARIAVARLRFDELKSHLQVVVYDLKGKVVHESKSIAWGTPIRNPTT